MDGGGVEIEVTLVAACRPDLLATTLESFAARVFRHFRVVRFVANIDPMLGTEAEGDRCEALIRARFPDADVTRPDTPGFGQAVKSVWARTGDRVVLHLEDDWRALADVTPDMIQPHLQAGAGMVALAPKPRAIGEPEAVTRTRKINFLGLTLARRVVSGYGTSPRFVAAGLAARYAALLIPELDPEKQVLQDRNPALSRLQRQYACIKVWGPGSGALIEDLGREWLRAKNMQKIYRKSAVSWVDRTDL